MHWMNKLERKFGKYAVRNLIVYILGAYAVGYVIALVFPGIYSLLGMNPAAICQGQVWRLVTWVCTPPPLNLFTIFMFIFYYWIGQTLENVWGSFRYNVFIFMGLILMTLGPMLIYLISGLCLGFENAWNVSAETTYLNWTSFMAFAALFPDQEVRLMFILPIKMKWVAIAEGALLGYRVIMYIVVAVRQPAYAGPALSQAIMIILSVLNFLIYFLATRNYKRISPKEIRRKRKYRKQVRKFQVVGTRHRCAVCGRTEATNPELQFRFCSKCTGNIEYCEDHIYTHEHIT